MQVEATLLAEPRAPREGGFARRRAPARSRPAARAPSRQTRAFALCSAGAPGGRGSSAATFTAGACSCSPRPAGRSGWHTTAATSATPVSASSEGTAISGVPKKIARMRSHSLTAVVVFATHAVLLGQVVEVLAIHLGFACGGADVAVVPPEKPLHVALLEVGFEARRACRGSCGPVGSCEVAALARSRRPGA